MKVHRVVLCVVDFDGLGADGVESMLTTTRYPNHWIPGRVVSVDTRDVEWTDEHPLNQSTAMATRAFSELFK